MARHQRSLRITDAYRHHLIGLRNRTVQVVAATWRNVDPHDLNASSRPFLVPAVAAVTMAQTSAVHLSDAYLARFTSSELGRPVTPVGIDPAPYAGVARGGGPVVASLAVAFGMTRMVLGQGRPPGDAMTAGLARLIRSVRTDVMAAGGDSLSELMGRSERIAGYQRVTSGDPCGACMALADGGLRHTDVDLEIHPSCSCTAEPVVEGVDQEVQRPTGKDMFEQMSADDQDRLFAGRGGADKAELLRSGDITLSDLVSTDGGWLTETPLERIGK